MDIPAILLGASCCPASIGDRLVGAYSRHLFGDATLQDLPDRAAVRLQLDEPAVRRPLAVLEAVYADYRVGEIERPTRELALAVAASSAFPPVLSPVKPNLALGSYKPATGTTSSSRVHEERRC